MNRLIISLAFVGCSSGNITSTELDEALSQYDGNPSADVVKPRNGEWSYTSSDIVSDTCSNLIDILEVGDGFTVDRNGLSFTLTMSDSDAGASCNIGGNQFDCKAVQEVASPEDTVTFTTTMDTRGALYSADTMEGVHELDITCEGPGCTLLEIARDSNFPCKFGVFYTAVAL